MQCPICDGNVSLGGPQKVQLRIFNCESCGSYEIEKSHLLKFLALHRQDRAQALRRARELAAPGERPALGPKPFVTVR
jgi:hypothetical protein